MEGEGGKVGMGIGGQSRAGLAGPGKTKGGGRVGLAARARPDWLMSPVARGGRNEVKRAEAAGTGKAWPRVLVPCGWMDRIYSRKGDDGQGRIPQVGGDRDGWRTLAGRWPVFEKGSVAAGKRLNLFSRDSMRLTDTWKCGMGLWK